MRQQNLSKLIARSAAIAVAVGISAQALGAVQTYSKASMEGGVGIDHVGFGFFQFDPGLWDTGLDANPRFGHGAGQGDGEFSFSGSDGAFTQQTNTVLGLGLTGRATDHGAYFKFDYNPAPPDRSFGNFWFGGVGNDIGAFPKVGGVPVAFDQVLMYADVLAQAGKPLRFAMESNFTSQNNGRRFDFTGTGTWQTVGGVMSTANAIGVFDLNDPQIAAVISFGQGNEITVVDDGTVPGQFAEVYVDNLTMTIKEATWSGTAGGNWNDNTNWSPIAPDGANAVANFGGSTAQTITTNFDHFVGVLNLNNAAGYTFSGTGGVSLRGIAIGTYTNNASINVSAGNHTISSATDLYSPTAINVANAANTLTLSNLLPTNVGITKTGPGTLAVNNVRAASLTVNGGTVSVLANGGSTGTSRVGTLAISGARVDLNDNDLIVTSSSYSAVTSLISSARNGGSWNGNGLTSSTAAAATPKNKTLGTLTGTQYLSLGQTTFDGFTVAASDVLVKFTYYGDTDLNGVVNFDDYARTDAGFNGGGTTWFQGDNDYNGLVNFDDYSLLDLAFNTQSGTLIRAMDWLEGEDRSMRGMDDPALQKVVEHYQQFGNGYATSFLNAVPEPSSALALAAIGSVLGLRRRRSK